MAKNYKLKMEAMYKTYTIVDTSQTDGDCGEVITKVYDRNLKSKDGFHLADSKDRIEFEAVPKEGYKFREWEFMAPNITGPGSTNPEVNLKSPVIEIKLPYMAFVGSEHNYHLKLKAIFTEEGNEIEEILDLVDEEFIQGYDKYQLPKVLGVKYSDGSKGLETAIWDRNIESAKLGENIFIGTILGTDKTVEFKVTMRKIIDIKEEYKFQELTIYNNDWFGEGRWYKLPEKARVMVSDGSYQLEKEINIKNWEGSDVMADGKAIIYYKHGTYEAEGIIEGFNKNIKFKLNVKKESEKAKFNVVFNTNRGSEISPQEMVEGKVSKPNDPVREGYRFIAWYIDDKLSEEFDFDMPITENITLYARWEEIITEGVRILSVELLKDGKIIAVGSFKGKDITINLPKEMSQGEIGDLISGEYKMKIVATEGVSIIQEGGYEGDWSNGDITNSIMVGGTKKFTLKKGGQSTEYYIEIKEFHQVTENHTVTFDTNGGSNISSQIVKDGNKAILPSNPTKNGYKFISWCTDSSLINLFNFNTAITVETTLYAKWETVSIPVVGKCTLAFNTNGGSSILSQEVDEGNKATKPSNPTKSGYNFLNWYTESNVTNIFSFNTPITKDITIYAKWDRVVEESSSAKITKFSLLGYEGSIDDRNGYITVYIPYDMELNSLVPNITLSEGATISPRADVAVNFNRSVYYTVYAKDGSKKEYRVSIDTPRENSSRENYWDDYYDNYKRKRDDYYKKRSEISWWEMSQEAKAERAKEALKDNRDELLIYKERAKIMNEIGKIESSFKNSRSSLYFSEEYNKIEIKPTVSNFAEGHSNMITIPKGILSSLPKGEYNYLTYATGVVNIDIYPFMETVTGLRLNLKDVSNDIRQKWNKIKGKGFIFEVESDSTKGGLSYELNLENKYPIEKLRFVKYDYTKGSFIDVSPEKWYVFDGKLRCENVSAGIYGIIYKD